MVRVGGREMKGEVMGCWKGKVGRRKFVLSTWYSSLSLPSSIDVSLLSSLDIILYPLPLMSLPTLGVRLCLLPLTDSLASALDVSLSALDVSLSALNVSLSALDVTLFPLPLDVAHMMQAPICTFCAVSNKELDDDLFVFTDRFSVSAPDSIHATLTEEQVKSELPHIAVGRI